MPFKILWPLDFLVCSSPSYPRCRVSICFFFSVPSRLFFSIIFLVSSVLLLFLFVFIILCFYFHFIFHFVSLSSSVLFMIFNFVFPPSLFLFAPPTSRLCPPGQITTGLVSLLAVVSVRFVHQLSSVSSTFLAQVTTVSFFLFSCCGVHDVRHRSSHVHNKSVC
uniref:Uncharacterized protein n=1 Tax=Cacopsylla melanoneura TaxID=428564 RepID=A0A8D8Y5I4_9HEMI